MGRENDFTKPIKALAARKVGYLCSCPSCHRITVGSSRDGKSSVSVGEAAHIYPASEGFSRYESGISSDFIKSEKNCLWLCATHHTLVDKDSEKFTAEELLIWKKDAERFAGDQLELSTIRFGDFKDKKYDINLLDSIFYDYLKQGLLIRLFNIIDLFDNANSDTDLKQLFSYYRIVIYYYNNADLLDNELKKFFSIENKIYKNKVISFLIENNEKDRLNQLKMMIPDELLDIATIVMNEEIIGRIISFDQEVKQKKINASREILSKLFSNFIYYGIPEYRTIVKNVFDENEELYSNEFIYKIHATMIYLMSKIEADYSFLDNEIIKDEKYLWLVSNKDKISEYDMIYQVEFWEFLISVNTYPDRIDNFLNQVPDSIKEHPKIELIRYGKKLKENFDDITLKDLKEKSLETGNYTMIISHLKFGTYKYANQILKFLNENQILLEKSSDILQTWIEVNEIFNFKTDISDFRTRFDKTYISDILYHCILTKLYFDNKNGEFKNELININNLFKKGYSLSIYGLDFYITILQQTREYERLLDVIKIPKQIETKIRIASILTLSNESKYIDIATSILENIRETGYESAGLFHSMAIDYLYRGEIKKAKQHFGKSYELMRTPVNAYNYFGLKLSSGEELSSDDINYCNASGDPKLIEILLNYYLTKSNVDKIKESFIRYFSMIGESNLQMLKSYFHYLSLHSKNPKNYSVVDINSTITISTDTEKINITVHNDLVLKGISAKTFFNSKHFSFSDPIISDIIFKKIGDVVVFNEKKYKIDRIIDIEIHFYHYLIGILANQNLVTTITGDPNKPEEVIKSIMDVVEVGHKQTKKIINEYNDKTITPLTMLSKVLGKGIIDTVEFINFDNTKSFINNLEVRKNKVFLISYDVLLTFFDLFEKNMLNSYEKLFISQTTKTRFIQEIENDLVSLDSDNNAGTMTMIEGKLTYFEDSIERKTNRKIFLHNLNKFIKRFNVIDPVKTEIIKNEFVDFLGKNDLLIDRDTLITAYNNKNIDLITDNLFLYTVANQLEIDNCGMVDFINNEIIDVDNLIDAVITLAKRNYRIYISLETLHILNLKYVEKEQGDKNKIKERMIEIFSCKIFEGKNDHIINQNKELMIELYRLYYHNYNSHMNDLIENLGNYALEYYKELHNEELQKMVQERLKEILLR